MSNYSKHKASNLSNGIVKYTLKSIQNVYGGTNVSDDKNTAVSKIKKRNPASYSRRLIKETFDFLVNSRQITISTDKKGQVPEKVAPKTHVEGKMAYTTPDGQKRSFSIKPITQISGRIVKTLNDGYVLEPLSRKHQDIKIRLVSDDDAANHVNKIVGVRLFQSRFGYYDATIEKTLEGAELSSPLISRIMALVYDHEVEMTPNEDFLPKILTELARIPDKVSENETSDKWSLENMRQQFPNFIDARALPFVTIDPKTCKDMDDSVYVERHKNGGFTQYVAISLVSIYIQKGSEIFKDALKRGNSTYFADMVAPMLMQKLSNGIGSLNPNQDRLALITKLEYDKNGNLLESTIEPGVITSRHKFAYEDVDKIISGDAVERGKHSQEILDGLDNLQKLEDILRPIRQSNGSTKFLTREFTYRLNATRTGVKSLHADNSTKAHEMVETPMLSANQAFATFAAENNIPIIYRVEDFIEEEKIEQITALLEKMQIPFDFDGHYESFGSLQIAINKAVARANAKNGELFAQVVSEQLIKCLPRARYDTENCGHFALSFEEYAHTTSPIRRFADLINQMQILAFKSGKPLPFKDEELREICSHINYTERNSAELEMQTDELLNAWFVKQRLDNGEDLTEKGYISRVARDRITIATSYGSAIVELADSAYDSPFRLSEDMLSIKNSVTKKEYHVGQPLEVKPTKVDIDSCAINAEIIFEKGSAERNSQYADEIRNFYGGGRNV